MRLRDDTRAAAIQIGAVLLFAALIVALASYQAVVVPEQNRADEFDHNTQVQGDLQDVRNAILTTAGTGTSQSVSVGLGTEFRNRIFALNPPDPAGQLQTENGEIVIENAVAADGEVQNIADVLNETEQQYETSSLVYRPRYSEYTNAPTTVYEHSSLYNDNDGVVVPLADQRLIDGDRITLVALEGSVSESRSGTISLDTHPKSVSTNTIEITGDGTGPIELRLPTQLPDEVEASLIDAEEDENVSVTTGDDEMTIELDGNETYELRMASVELGGTGSEDATYIVPVSETETAVNESVTVEVRDRFNNPTRGATVTPDGAGLENDTVSDSDGHATFVPEEAGNLTLSIGDEAYENVSFTVTEPEGEDAEAGNGSDAAFRTFWDLNTTAEQEGVTCVTNCTVDAGENAEPELSVATDPSAEGAMINYAVNDTEVAGLSSTMGSTDANGTDTVSLEPRENGTVTVYTSGGGSGDALELTVENVTSEDPIEESGFETFEIYDESGTTPPGQDGTVSYSIEYELDDEDVIVTADFENLDAPEATESVESSEQTGTLHHGPSFGEADFGDRYVITVRILSADGTVLEAQQIQDTADGIDPGI